MIVPPHFLVAFWQPWADLYADSKVLPTVVTFAHVGGLLFAGGLAVTLDQGTLRIDHQFSTNNTAFARYSAGGEHGFMPENLPGFGYYHDNLAQQGMGSYSHVFTPTLLNVATVAVSRLSMNHTTESAYKNDITGQLGIQGVGFGGPGPHFCLGAHLARREVAVAFRQLLTRLPDIEVVGEAVPLEAMGIPLVGGIKHLPVRFTPTARRPEN